MTCREKLKLEHPELVSPKWQGGCFRCPSDYNYLSGLDDCTYEDCTSCWDREIPEEDSIEGKFTVATPIDDAITKASEAFEECTQSIENFAKKVSSKTRNSSNLIIGDEKIEHPDTDIPQILDSGNRREFETGAVRDIQEGKGRCDLMPLDVVVDYLDNATGCGYNMVLARINRFIETGKLYNLHHAVAIFTEQHWENDHTMLLEVAKHFEEGAKKYGEHNWQKGIPVHCYIDSAVRHYLKFLRGDKDEPHDRAFCWNILCAIWTCKHKPELNEYRKEKEDVSAT